MDSKNIRVLLLDLGNVLIDIDGRRALKILNTHSPCDAETLKRLAISALHHDYERGHVSSDEFFRGIKKELFLDHPLDLLEKAWVSILGQPIPNVWENLHVLSQNSQLKLCLLSNTNESHWQHIKQRQDLNWNVFDHIFTSFELGHRKPDREIFETVCQHLNTSPDEVLFLDDHDENLKSAKNIGIKARHCYQSASQFVNILNEFGIALT